MIRLARLRCLATFPLFGVAAFLVAATFVTSPAALDAADRPPNIVVIMADDLGYGDISAYGATEIQTPHIDRLANDGVRFTNGYCSASTCTPTRYSFLTGNYAFRTKGTGIAPPNSPALIPGGTETVASILQRSGYRTAVIGKWHLGLGTGDGPDWNGKLSPGPLEIGFDQCFLLPTTNDRVPQVYVQNHHVLDLDPADPLWVGKKKPSPDHPTGISHRSTLKMDWTHGHNQTIHNGISRIGFYTGGEKARFNDEDLADAWVVQSERFMTENRERPFFLFFASHDLHVPRMPHPRYQGKSKLGFRGDSILQLDDCVGRLRAKIEELGLTENTLIVFCSDNGPVLDDGYADGAIEQNGTHRAGGPFRGGKYSIYEGGTRTPFITAMPGRISPGTSDEVVCTIDLAASFAALSGATISPGACTDSVDVMDALMGQPGSKGRDVLVQQDNGTSGTLAIRRGNWKLLHHPKKQARNLVVEQLLANVPVPEYQLFDLSADPGETQDRMADEPEIAEQLKKMLSEY